MDSALTNHVTVATDDILDFVIDTGNTNNDGNDGTNFHVQIFQNPTTADGDDPPIQMRGGLSWSGCYGWNDRYCWSDRQRRALSFTLMVFLR